jgi:aldose 1-epimerase
MFEIKKEAFGKCTRLKLINVTTGEYVSVIPEFGTNVNELVLGKKGNNYSIIAGDAVYEDFIKNAWHKGSKLIPYPNRINDGTYFFDCCRYRLPINFVKQNHAIHGLIYDKKFNLVGQHKDETSIAVDLEYKYAQDVPGFPFFFSVLIHYALSERGVLCKTRITNNGSERMPAGDGWHPYFKTNGIIDDLWLQLPSQELLEVNDRMIPTGRITQFDKYVNLTPIGSQKFDSCFALPQIESRAGTQLHDPKQSLRIFLWQETGEMKYNYLQVYIPPARDSIALEPMTCPADAFNSGKGLIVLEPGQDFHASYGVSIE